MYNNNLISNVYYYLYYKIVSKIVFIAVLGKFASLSFFGLNLRLNGEKSKIKLKHYMTSLWLGIYCLTLHHLLFAHLCWILDPSDVELSKLQTVLFGFGLNYFYVVLVLFVCDNGYSWSYFTASVLYCSVQGQSQLTGNFRVRNSSLYVGKLCRNMFSSLSNNIKSWPIFFLCKSYFIAKLKYAWRSPWLFHLSIYLLLLFVRSVVV